MDSGLPNLLVLVLDSNSNEQLYGTDSKGTAITLDEFLDHLKRYLNGFLLVHPRNEVVAFVGGKGLKSPMVYPKMEKVNVQTSEPTLPRIRIFSGQAEREKARQVQDENPCFFTVTDRVISAIRESLSECNNGVDGDGDISTLSKSISSSGGMSGGLSLALCYINKFLKQNKEVVPRLLLFQTGDDVKEEYVPLMNGIFCAQRQSVIIDALILNLRDSSFLQQACDLSGGIYCKPECSTSLSQYLLSLFLSDASTRQAMVTPTLKSVDYRSICFCHRKAVDLSYVCSVCFAVYCEYQPGCKMCGARFFAGLPLPPKGKMRRKKKKVSKV